MAGTAIKVEWYVARDGKPHGPLSEAEMLKFVELGHLRPSDLVWRTGFVEWQPGATAFPRLDAQNLAPWKDPEPARGGTPLEAANAAVASIAAVVEENRAPERTAQAVSRSHGEPSVSPAAAAPSPAAPLGSEPRGRRSRPQPKIDEAKWQVDEAPPAERRRSRGARRFAIMSVVVFIAAGLALLAWLKFDEFKAGGGGVIADIISKAPAALSSKDGGSGGGGPFDALVASGDTAEALDTGFQRAAIWRTLKASYPDWYAERIRDIQRFRFEKRDEAYVARYLADAITTLRRKNAELALASSRPKLRKIATTFLDSLEALNQANPTACFEYISQGETTLAGLDNLKSRQNAALQAQMIATFEAIDDGRSSPQSHQTGRRTDYDHLASLLVKVGWTQSDLQIFSDPRLLARAEPPKVCTMVRDWFRTQLTISDEDMQTRLLFDSIRPLVAG